MQRPHLLVLAIALLAVTALSACKSGRPAVPDTLGLTEPIPILRSETGSDAALTVAGAWLINSYEELEATGSEALSNVDIDFDAESLVVVTLGEQPTGGYAVDINGLSLHDGELYITGAATEPDADAATVQMLTHPYAAVVVSKVHAELLHPEID